MAVPDGQDTLVTASVQAIPGVTPTLVRARVSGRILAMVAYRGRPDAGHRRRERRRSRGTPDRVKAPGKLGTVEVVTPGGIVV